MTRCEFFVKPNRKLKYRCRLPAGHAGSHEVRKPDGGRGWETLPYPVLAFCHQNRPRCSHLRTVCGDPCQCEHDLIPVGRGVCVSLPRVRKPRTEDAATLARKEFERMYSHKNRGWLKA